MRSRKGTMVGDPAVSFALNQLTKDALNDLIHGLAMERLGLGALGPDESSRLQEWTPGPDVVILLQKWADGIAQVRRERPVALATGVEKYRKIEAKKRAKHREEGE